MVFGWRKKYRQGTLIDRKVVTKAASPTPDLLPIAAVDYDGRMSPPLAVNGHSVKPQGETV
jgi:hypothetical protein